jgi:enamine deaminase RidA (YjgF/YER057c/UK114 family)
VIAAHLARDKEWDMTIKRQNAGPRMSQAVVHGNTVYLAGQVASDASAGVKGQTEQVLKKIDGLLASVGSDKSKLLSATVYLASMSGYDEMNAAWDAWVSAGNTPGRATVEAKLASPGYLVEIAAIAAV